MSKLFGFIVATAACPGFVLFLWLPSRLIRGKEQTGSLFEFVKDVYNFDLIPRR